MIELQMGIGGCLRGEDPAGVGGRDYFSLCNPVYFNIYQVPGQLYQNKINNEVLRKVCFTLKEQQVQTKASNEQMTEALFRVKNVTRWTKLGPIMQACGPNEGVWDLFYMDLVNPNIFAPRSEYECLRCLGDSKERCPRRNGILTRQKLKATGKCFDFVCFVPFVGRF